LFFQRQRETLLLKVLLKMWIAVDRDILVTVGT
jgi:hypothetical protein